MKTWKTPINKRCTSALAQIIGPGGVHEIELVNWKNANI